MNPIYQLSFSTNHCGGTATLNGFPVATFDVKEQGAASLPVNSLLVGKGNRLVVNIDQTGDDPSLLGSLKTANQGDVVVVPGGDDIKLPDGSPPHVVEFGFDSPMAPMARILEQAGPVTEEEAVDFAILMRDILEDGIHHTLAQLFEAKVELAAEGFGVDKAMIEEGLHGEAFDFMFNSDLDFGREDVVTKHYCDGKVVHLRRSDGYALVHGESEDGSSNNMEIYVARVGDKLRIVY